MWKPRSPVRENHHDRFFAFWFKYVLPNRGRLEIGNEEFILKQIEATWTST